MVGMTFIGQNIPDRKVQKVEGALGMHMSQFVEFTFKNFNSRDQVPLHTSFPIFAICRPFDDSHSDKCMGYLSIYLNHLQFFLLLFCSSQHISLFVLFLYFFVSVVLFVFKKDFIF